MTGVSHQAIIGSGARLASMIEMITGLGLTSGLKLCLDAGDASSYTSGQSWLDRSGNGYDFFRGTTSGAQATDPTFNGTAGGQSAAEYWSLDGGDFFTYDTTNETWMNNLHKNNAVFAFAMWWFLPDNGVADGQCLVGDNDASTTGIGINVSVKNTGTIILGVSNGSGTVARSATTSAIVAESEWVLIAGTLDEAANTLTLMINGTQESFSSSYTSPSASSATRTLAIAADGFGDAQLSPGPGTRLASVAFWEGQAPSAAGLLDLYNASKGKFGH